jgi:hypothetical protein
VVEEGDVFFFYRPRVDTDEVDDLGDVQRFFLVLEPDRDRRYRRIVVARKRLADPRRHEREWAFVAEVADDPAELRDEVEGGAYETRARDVRVQPPARPAGEGRYAIVEHDGHAHLAYVLELPRGARPGPGGVRHPAGGQLRRRGAQPCGGGAARRRAPDAGAGGLPPSCGSASGAGGLPRSTTRGCSIGRCGARAHRRGRGRRVRLGVRLDQDEERLETADLFRQLRIGPGELPVEPLERGELR